VTQDGNGELVDVDWTAGRETNLANWEQRVPIHRRTYDLEALMSDPAALSPVVRDDLPVLEALLPGGLAGRDLCHLQCHIGTDTVSLARAGASATGVDFSPSALAAAAELADQLGVAARWVQADVLDAATVVGAQFDVVYTSIGTIVWLDDLDRWAAQIAALLRPGGLFYFRDTHPALNTVDPSADELVLRHPYFTDGRAERWDSDQTYTGGGTVSAVRTFQWHHPVSEIVTALLGAGLTLARLDEGRTLPWRFSQRMVPAGDGWQWPEPDRDRIPCTLTIAARKE